MSSKYNIHTILGCDFAALTDTLTEVSTLDRTHRLACCPHAYILNRFAASISEKSQPKPIILTLVAQLILGQLEGCVGVYLRREANGVTGKELIAEWGGGRGEGRSSRSGGR